MTEQEYSSQDKRRDRWLLWLIFVLFLLGIGFRGYSYSVQASDSGGQQRTLQPDGLTGAPAEHRTTKFSTQDSEEGGDSLEAFQVLELIAPYLTEGGLSFFLGFCIGFFLRFVAKTVMLLVGAIYCGLILLSHYGVVTVDWGLFQQLLQELLFNTRTHLEGVQGLLSVGLPSVGLGAVGIWRGVKKH